MLPEFNSHYNDMMGCPTAEIRKQVSPGPGKSGNAE